MLEDATVLIRKLTASNQTLSTVESCTGGLLFGYLTAVPGASAVLERGFITYSNQAKQEMVGVKADTLAAFGAVSQQTAEEMAKGGCQNARTDLSISLTGIAGPSGGSAKKPVGLVWISAFRKDGIQQTERHLYTGDRQQIRMLACTHAISLLLRLSSS
ncbi:MAG: CinA family protein [Pseudomonadota bacterium]|nr:CinA family protein [Pseudomonadota bacterium]